jgi:hypothetical protein
MLFKALWGEEKKHEKAVEEAFELLKLYIEEEFKEKRFFG